MSKYTVVITFFNGQIRSMQAEKINFHPGTGGIDIFEDNQPIPVFPGREEEVKSIRITLNNQTARG